MASLMLFNKIHNEAVKTLVTDNAFVSDARFGHKVGQIVPKWDKSETYWDIIRFHNSVHFGSVSNNILKSDLKKFEICPFWG